MSLRDHGPADAGHVLPCRGGLARRRVRLCRDQRNADQDGHRDGYAAGFASTSAAGLLAIAVPDHGLAADRWRG
jgi:hypothetical protein